MATLNRDKYHMDLKGSEQHLPLKDSDQKNADPDHAQAEGTPSKVLKSAVKQGEGDTQLADKLRKAVLDPK